MTEPRGVNFDSDGAVGIITLNRPDVANTFDLPAAHALGQAVSAAEASGVRAVLLRGEGKRFCAGGDVASFVAAEDRSTHLNELATVLDRNIRRLAALPVPVVTAVQGAVAGAGLSFLLNADVVISARNTKFVMAYSSIGLTPDCGVSYLLPRVVGQQRALALALTGRVLSAGEALDWGLVAEVVDDVELAARVEEIVAKIASGPTQAFAETKRLVRGSLESTRDENAQDEARTIARLVDTEQSKTLIENFLGVDDGRRTKVED